MQGHAGKEEGRKIGGMCVVQVALMCVRVLCGCVVYATCMHGLWECVSSVMCGFVCGMDRVVCVCVCMVCIYSMWYMDM